MYTYSYTYDGLIKTGLQACCATHSSLQPRMSGEWHTGEVVNLCKSYGFIRISKDGKSEDIFFYYGDVRVLPETARFSQPRERFAVS